VIPITPIGTPTHTTSSGGSGSARKSVSHSQLPQLPQPTTFQIPAEIPMPSLDLDHLASATIRTGNDFGPGNGIGHGISGIGIGDSQGDGNSASSHGLRNVGEVDIQAYALPGAPRPVYPSLLQSAGTEGTVMAGFVVDTTGRFEPASLTIMYSDHPLFSAAVRQALEHTRYRPAQVAGQPVRQRVQQRFTFSLKR